MTPEQEMLIHMSNLLERIDERTQRFDAWIEDHEEEDGKVHQDVESLKESRSQVTTAVKVAGAILAAVGSVVVWLVQHALAQ